MEATLEQSRGELTTETGVEHDWRTAFDVQFSPRLTSILAPYELPYSNWQNKEERPNLFYCPEDVAALWIHSLFRQSEKLVEDVKLACEEHGVQG